MLRSTGNKTPMKEYQYHSPRHPCSIQIQPMPNMRPCQVTQGRYGAVEAAQKVNSYLNHEGNKTVVLLPVCGSNKVLAVAGF